jgi:succinyl-diaminopimelate desuccinylase
MSNLLAATRDLMAVPSPSRGEAALAGVVEDALRACPWLDTERIGDNVIGRTSLDHGQRLVLAGHLDTVPANGNEEPRLEGDTLWGLGASDMKGGLAVMLDLATTVRQPVVDVTWCFYAREEIGRADSGLLELWQERPDLLAGDAAILGEPTGAVVEAGCQGTMRMRVTLRGIRAHTARPFTGRNAIHRMAPLLQRVADWPGREVELDGCTYAEQVQAVSVEGGVAGNVVPDEARVTLNHRYAPDRGAKEAEAFLLELLQGTWDPETPWGIRSCTHLWRRVAPRPRRRWAGPTWRRSGSTGCRRPTSAPGTLSWLITPTSGCRRRSSSAPARSSSPSSRRAAQRTMIVPFMYWWMLQM